MAAIKVFNMKGSEVGTMELNDNVFGVEYREPLIHQAVVTRLANERQGTKSTLTRSEVRGGGIKPWRQRVRVVLVKVLSAHPNGLRVA